MTPYFQDENITLYNCEVMQGLAQIPDGSIQCCVTSPPYWGLRDYGNEGQLGLEKTPEEYVENMVLVFRAVHRVLKKDGTFWLNIGDSYSQGKIGRADGNRSSSKFSGHKKETGNASYRKLPPGYKPKDLIGIPWMLAFALRADGWYLRNDIIWNKPNPMPESVTDRCTRAHEYIFHFTKSAKYFYDADAIREPWNSGRDDMPKKEQQANGANKRTVWKVATKPYPDAHFATFPPKLIEPCILAGSKPGDIVLEPFWGSGTTGEVSIKHGRKTIGIELSADYCELSLKRFKQKTLNFI